MSKNAALVKRNRNNEIEKEEDSACGQCNKVYAGKTGRKLSTWMKEHVKSKAKRDDKSLFRIHCNDDGY